MFLRIHRSAENREVVGVCDRELVGKTFTEGALSITVTEAFFGDKVASEDEIINVLKQADNATIYGDRSVNLAIREGILEEENCRRIGGVLIANLIRV
jgi:uncharacterized protein